MKSWIVTPQEEGTLSFKYVSRLLPNAPSGLLRKSMRKKNITLNKKKIEGREVLKAGDEVQIWFSDDTLQKFMGEEKKGRKDNMDFPSLILYEDDEILVLNKPAGLLSQGDASGAGSLNDGLLAYLHDLITPAFRPSICNRLDRNTSGIVLAGKTMNSLQKLNEMIKTRKIQKFYKALVLGETGEEGTYGGYMVKDSALNRVAYRSAPEEGARAVETRFERELVKETKGIIYSLVRVELVTGFSHQIRVHFAHDHHPLLGEKKYGTKESVRVSEILHIHRQMLHSSEVVFPEMEGELAYLSGKSFKAPLPKDMEKVISAEL